MRFKHFKPSNLTEEQLDELRMAPSNLQQFLKSDEAQGIQAGFEAELVFTGLGGEPEYDEDPEPDYDADERCHSIDGVVEFFTKYLLSNTIKFKSVYSVRLYELVTQFRNKKNKETQCQLWYLGQIRLSPTRLAKW